MEKGQGQIKIPTADPSYLITIIRSGANTDFPELKNWRFKKKEGYVLAIPKLSIEAPYKQNNEELDFFGILGILMSDDESNIEFNNVTLNDDEYNNLLSFCEKKSITLSKTPKGIRCQRSL